MCSANHTANGVTPAGVDRQARARFHTARHDQRGLAVLEIVVLVLIVGVLISVGAVLVLTKSDKNQDQETQKAVKQAEIALGKYKDQHGGSYQGVTADALRKIDKDLPKELQDPVLAGPSYSVAIESGTGVLYRLTREASGNVTRTCVVPPNGETGDCKANKFGVGSW